MSSYFNLTLDTTGPSGVSVKINGDEINTTTTAATLSISCADADLTGYQMKIWGNIVDSMGMPIATENDATWQNFSPSLNVMLENSISGDNELRTVYVKLRDDVWNESEIASDSITLCLTAPTVNVVSNVSKISKKSTKSWGTFRFTVDMSCEDLKVMVVTSVNATVDDPTNVEILFGGEGNETTLGSYLMSVYNGNLTTNTEYDGVVSGAYLEKASPGDGAKIVKLFVKRYDGPWSV